MLGGDLPHKERFQGTTPTDVFQDLLEPPQVYGVLGQSTASEDPHGDGERALTTEIVTKVQLTKRVDERCAVQHRTRSRHAGGKKTHARSTESSHQILGQHSQALLKGFVARQANRELAQLLSAAVVVGEDMRTHFVLD